MCITFNEKAISYSKAHNSSNYHFQCEMQSRNIWISSKDRVEKRKKNFIKKNNCKFSIRRYVKQRLSIQPVDRFWDACFQSAVCMFSDRASVPANQYQKRENKN